MCIIIADTLHSNLRKASLLRLFPRKLHRNGHFALPFPKQEEPSIRARTQGQEKTKTTMSSRLDMSSRWFVTYTDNVDNS
mmetsp:Transcript_22603/g.40793  ORF Transcript_22603/g.40793 Transcript_22603/m.40793 type:complete len:80 (-) Transcript_22603:779-1018(-)